MNAVIAEGIRGEGGKERKNRKEKKVLVGMEK